MYVWVKLNKYVNTYTCAHYQRFSVLYMRCMRTQGNSRHTYYPGVRMHLLQYTHQAAHQPMDPGNTKKHWAITYLLVKFVSFPDFLFTLACYTVGQCYHPKSCSGHEMSSCCESVAKDRHYLAISDCLHRKLDTAVNQVII